MELSPDQQRALDAVLAWYDATSAPRTLTLGGYAGTGKTTVIRQLIAQMQMRLAKVDVCAFTGKAVSVLKGKGVRATTMHKLIYMPYSYCTVCMDEGVGFCRRCKTSSSIKQTFSRVSELPGDLVIVDEASMLNAELVRDLEDLAGRVLYVGDHGQLQPIGDDPGIMRSPELRLEQIHRQAEGSAIIRFAHDLRAGRHPLECAGGAGVQVHRGARNVRVSDFDALLCGYNKTRCELNARVRKERGFQGTINVGERVICLQNDKDLNLYNGMLATVTAVTPGRSDALVKLDLEDDLGDRRTGVPALVSQFGALAKPERRTATGIGLLDYGYAMTVHKAQGSEWERVAVFEQISPSWSSERWRYTAATRASQELTYFVSDRRRR